MVTTVFIFFVLPFALLFYESEGEEMVMHMTSDFLNMALSEVDHLHRHCDCRCLVQHVAFPQQGRYPCVDPHLQHDIG